MPYLLKLAGLSSPLCKTLTTGLANKISQVRNLTNKKKAVPLLLKLAGLSSPLCRALTAGLANEISQVRNLINRRAVPLCITYFSWL